jgi:hypothetical protein
VQGNLAYASRQVESTFGQHNVHEAHEPRVRNTVRLPAKNRPVRSVICDYSSAAASPVLRRVLLGKSRSGEQYCVVEGAVYIRAAIARRMLAAGYRLTLLVDEFRTSRPEICRPARTLSPQKRPYLSGTPKRSTIICRLCSLIHRLRVDAHGAACGNATTLDEPPLGPSVLFVQHARQHWKRQGYRQRPTASDLGQGFRICHPMVPWLNFDEILERR